MCSCQVLNIKALKGVLQIRLSSITIIFIFIVSAFGRASALKPVSVSLVPPLGRGRAEQDERTMLVFVMETVDGGGGASSHPHLQQSLFHSAQLSLRSDGETQTAWQGHRWTAVPCSQA